MDGDILFGRSFLFRIMLVFFHPFVTLLLVISGVHSKEFIYLSTISIIQYMKGQQKHWICYLWLAKTCFL